MKKLVALVLGIVLINPAFAVGTDSGFDPGAEEVKDLQFKGKARRTIYRRSSRSEFQQKDLPSKSESVSSFNRRTANRGRRSTGVRSTQRKVITSQNNFETERFTSTKTAFSVELPVGFTQVSDTIEKDSGSISFEKGETLIRIDATDQMCNSSGTGVPACLRSFEKSYIETSLSNFTFNQKVQARQVRLREQLFGNTNGQAALWSAFTVNTGTIGNLIFIEPQSGYIWVLSVQAAQGDNLLSRTQFLTTLQGSLFATAKKATTATTRITDPTLTSTRRYSPQSTDTTRRRKSEVIESDVYKKVIDSGQELSVSLPKEYEVITDTPATEEGWVLKGTDNDHFTIRKTDTVCDPQIGRNRLTCFDEATKALVEDFVGDNEWTIRDQKGFNLQLSRSSSARDDIGRFYMWESNGERIGFLSFMKPEDDTVWYMTIRAARKRNAVLWDSRVFKRIVSSIRSEITE